jgi:transposase
MQTETPATAVATTARDHSNTLFASLALRQATWLATANSPGAEKVAQPIVAGGDGALLRVLLARVPAKAAQRHGVAVTVVVIQQAGRDGFWGHRLLVHSGIASQVVAAAASAVARRDRRAKTDALDGQTL